MENNTGSGRKDLDILLGDPKRAIRNMFLPLLIAFAVVEVNQFADTFWISGLGKAASEAISVSIAFYGLLMCAGMGISVGATSAIAYNLAKSDVARAGSIASNALILSLLMGAVSSVLLFVFLDGALWILGATHIRTECWDYMISFILMAPIMMAHVVLGGLLRGEGAARKSTTIQVGAALFNIILDPVFIYILDMGIMGAGFATGLSALIALILGLTWYLRGKTVVPINMGNFRFSRESTASITSVGFPKTAQDLINSMTVFVQRIFIIIAGGTSAVMVYNYPFRITALFNLPGRALESSMLPVASAAFAVKDVDKMKAAFGYSMKLTVGSGIAFAVLVYLFAELFMSVFTYEDSMREMLPALTAALQLVSVTIPTMAAKWVGASLLQSMRKAKIPMYFDLFWSILRLFLFALSAYGFLGIDPFQGILYIMTGLNVLGGVIIVSIALVELRKLRNRVSCPHCS